MSYMHYSYRRSTPESIWIIITINTLILIFSFFASRFIYSFMGLTPAYFLARPWTILTNIFVHAGLLHLLTNMFTLYFFGSFLARLIGERKFLLVYFAGGIMGSLFYLWLGSPLTVAVGASGAIFALGGALSVLTPKLRVFIFPLPIPIPLWLAVIGGFLLLSFLPNIAWQAHLGGLLLGLAAGYYFRRRMRHFVII
ncbi:MAG: rhomboid family intramembrane serine protease [Dehalococcoidales bacterium]|nr:rhomboid family intramembrane serine protease [Dehalococcoidales bacterium]